MKTKYTAIIIDDEERARRTLKLLLNKYCPNIEILGDYESVPDGVLAINKKQPNIVFLDIEMPKYNGFELLGFFQEIDFPFPIALLQKSQDYFVDNPNHISPNIHEQTPMHKAHYNVQPIVLLR